MLFWRLTAAKQRVLRLLDPPDGGIKTGFSFLL